MIGFAVSTDVETRTLRKSALPWNEGLRSLLHEKIEQLGPPPPSPLVSAYGDHALARAAHDAFYEHYPLVLSPDTVWFTIAQGFAQHVNLNVDRLRDRLVQHAGKKTLRVDRPDFELGRENPWTEVFTEFSQQVGSHVGKLRDLVVCDFSTTTPTSRAASEVLLMDAFQGYFTYEMQIGCGIPAITLLGTVDDWRSVRRRAAMLSEFGLDHWTDVLLPLLDRVVSTAGGDVDVDFWSSFFRYESGSGPSEMTGWVNALFPYIRDSDTSATLVPNPHYAQWHATITQEDTRSSFFDFFDHPHGPSLKQLPSSLASAPVEVRDVRTGLPTTLRFVAGLVGVVQAAQDGALSPELGWAIVHDGDS